MLAHQFFDGKLERNLVVEFLVEGSGAAKRAGASEYLLWDPEVTYTAAALPRNARDTTAATKRK